MIVPALAERTIVIDTSSDVKKDYYYQVLTDVKDYRLTFPDYVQSVQLTQNDFGNFADLSVSGKGIGYDLQMSYSSDPSSSTFSGVVTKGEYGGSKVTITTSKTWSFYTKDPEGGTKIHAELKLKSSGLFSALSFVGDDSIKFGFQQALDKIGDRAKVLQQNSGNTQLVTAPPQSTTQPTQTINNPPVTTPPPITANIPTPTPPPKPTPPITPPVITQPSQPNPPITTPAPTQKLPIITLYSSSVNGMTVTIYGNAQSGTGKTLSNISFNWGDGESSTGQFPQTHTYSQAGTYTTSATVIDGGLSSSVTTSVVISTPTQQTQTPQQTQPQQIPPLSTVTIKTDLSNYKHGDTIVITGHVTNPYPGQNVAIKITSPSNNVVSAAQVALDNNGDFTETVSTVGNLWFENGEYTLTAQYGSTNTITQTTFSFTAISQPSSVSIANTSYKVSPGTYQPIPFSLSCSASVTGTFSAHAGLGNNIELFVFDQNNFQKYQNHNAYTYLYYNERTGSGTFNLNLTSGNYYIVLSNTYSTISEKNVDLQASYTCN